ncbi:hypothetical protein HA402_004337 [Bradysia odoriphaga]|nr:hypothetical protein HA402_004337 [Bradysia odoriphaga]
MSTSLSEQLQRLSVPQTSTLVESKKTASILYDGKKAAEIDRQTIFDLSKSGLEELILSNSVFRQFQNTLFDDSTINFERSVETGHVNETLDKNIRKFLFHLSPYFLIRAAHNCLEWLIRRHRIHEYNVDDMMALILPYHATMTFVKCLQTMSLGKRSRWHWMKPIQKPGVQLSKQTIINRAATDPAFLQFISKTTLDAVNELNANARAHTLQAWFAFYSTVTLGALNAANEVTDSHVSNISRTLLKGMSSDVVDFRAASMIITAFLMTKIKFVDIFLKKIIGKVTDNMYRQELRKESVALLIIICHTQDDINEAAVETFLSKMMDNPTPITAVIGGLYQDNVNVMPLCLPLITKCLGHVVDKKKAKGYRRFMESLFTELALNDDDANTVIRCILHALKRAPKPQSDIIDLNSDEDDDGDVHMENGKSDDGHWHSSLMRILETRYPEVFDALKTEIMSGQDEESCSLKIVLGALLCSTYNADPSGASIFIDLYHPSAQNRMNAVENLVKMNKLSTMPFSDDKKNLLVAGIAERLCDDYPDVVNEVLKFNTEDLIKIVGEQNLIKKLKFIIGSPFMCRKEWQQPIASAIKHITSKQLLSNDNEVEIFLAVWPYMFPMNEISFYHTKAITKSSIASRFPILKQLQDLKCNVGNRLECVNKRLENSFDKSKINEIIQFVKAIPDVEMTKASAFHIINLLTYVLPKNSDHNLSKDVFDIAMKCEAQFESKPIDIDQYAQELYSKNQPEKLPTQLLIGCIQTIITKTNFSTFLNSNIIDFTDGSDMLVLILKLHGYISNGLFAKSKRATSLFNQTMTQFIRFVLPDADKKLDFYSNFYIAHYIDQKTLTSISISPELQLRSMMLLNEMLAHTDTLNDIKMEVFVRIVSGLTSPFEAVRVVAANTIEMLYGLLADSSEYSKFFELILKEKEKLSMRPEELSLLLCHIKYKRAQLFEFTKQPNTAMILKAAMLDMLQHVNDDKHDTKYLKIAVEVALGILSKYDCSRQIVLNPHESIVVYQTIIRLNYTTLASIYANQNCLKFFETVLQQSNLLVRIDNKPQSISVHAMNLNLFNDFKKFTVKQQKSIINSIVESATFSKNSDVRKRASKFFRKSIELDGQLELDILTKMAKIASIDVTKKGRTEYLSTELLQSSEWRRGVTLLEFLHKKRLTHPLHLIRQMFPVLQKCLKFDDQSMVEYTKQLLLNAILNCCVLMPPEGRFLENDFKIDLVVQCVRGTQNPQTHHHALELLTKLATMIPDAVLHQIMEIFTFVGDAVVRRDDNYIYQLISNVIKSVVPILKQNNIVQVLKAFSDIILDVPAHRRPGLYEDLLNTLDPETYLWMFVALVFEKDVRETDDQKKLLRKTVIAVEIANLFDCDIILRTCYQLIVYLQNQLSVVDKNAQAHFKQIFDVTVYNKKRVLQHINQILKFVNVLTLERSEFSAKMALLDKQTLLQHKKTFKNIIPAILTYIKASTQSSLRNTDRTWNDGLSACYHILDHLLDLLYPDMLLQVVQALLSEDNEVEVRRKIIDLLNKKLDSPEQFADCKQSILALLDPLSKIVHSIPETPKNSSLPEDALVAIQLLSKIVAKDNPNEFDGLLKSLSKILQSYTELSIRLRAYLIQCLGELCANLRVHSLSHLHRFMPAITDVLNDQLKHKIDVTSPAFEIILKAIYRIVETVPKFLTPYLVNLITSLSVLWARLQSTSSNDSQKNLLILDKIWQTLASSLELRVLIPLVEKRIYPDLLAQGKFNATGPLMVLLLDSFGHSEQADLMQNCQDLTTFFLAVMDFRSQFHRQCDTVDVQEDFFIKTLIGFILKLSEGSFRPFYYKLIEWSKDTADKSFDRAITFYRLSSKVAESLKSLFITFASPIVQHAADLLKKKYTKAEIKASSSSPATLIYNVLATLQTIFLYGNHQFINSQRFNVLMEPLVDLLDQEQYLADENIAKILTKCYAQFAVEANNDLLWKQLNQQILKKTRSSSVAVRRWALLCSTEVVTQLGEDATQLYQEMIPFFSELLEDDDTEIQKLCSRCITEIERSTGEDLKKHL